MVSIISVCIVTAVISIVGGAIGYFVWLKTRPKKETWIAEVYQLSEGTREPSERTGLQLQDLKPYARDVLERIEKGAGHADIYNLQKIKKTTPAVEGDVSEYWGEGKRKVTVLYHRGSCTLLKKGYDKITGEIIFNPLSHGRISLIKNEMAMRQDRLQKEKDILQAITPWIVAGVLGLAMVAVAYIMISGYIEISENHERAMSSQLEREKVISNNELQVERLRQGTIPKKQDLGKQKTPKNET